MKSYMQIAKECYEIYSIIKKDSSLPSFNDLPTIDKAAWMNVIIVSRIILNEEDKSIKYLKGR